MFLLKDSGSNKLESITLSYLMRVVSCMIVISTESGRFIHTGVYCLPELTQDIASKGLGAVYESCNKDQKDKLVSMLVDTLMAGRK